MSLRKQKDKKVNKTKNSKIKNILNNAKEERNLKRDNSKIWGMIALIIAFGIASYNIIASTGMNIQDTNPASYIIVIMLMVFLFLVFSLKEDLKFRYSLKNILIGIIVFIIYIFVVSFLKITESFKFYVYRLDALMLPFLLIALIIIIFGIDGIKKLKYAIIYSAFASPLILLPLLNMNNLFTFINAKIVFYILKMVQIPVSSTGMSISLISNQTISIIIGQACTDIGAFIALAAFLIPVVYLFNGKRKNKIIFFITSLAALLILNLARMFTIAMVWFYYGISNALALFHASAGPIIFYIIIAVMIIFSYKFKLIVPKINYKGSALWNEKSKIAFSIFIVLLFGIFNNIFLSSYMNLNIPIMNFKNSLVLNNFINRSVELSIINNFKSNGINATSFGAVKLNNIPGFNLKLSNSTLNAYAFVSLSNTESYIKNSNYSSLYIVKNGIVISSSILKGKTYTLILSHFSAPINVSGVYIPFNFLVFENYSATKFCSINYKTIGISNYFESELFNLIKSNSNIVTSPCIALNLASTFN